MKAFTIDSDNDITVFASSKEAKTSGRKADPFSSEAELGVLAEKWPGGRLVEIWNSLPGVKPVQKFTSRDVALRRIWEAIQHLKPPDDTVARTERSQGARSQTITTNDARGPGKKAALVIAMIKSSKGATLPQIMSATGWQAHTVRGFVSGHLKKKLGLTVRSFKRDGERVYSLKG
jgi:hypothetical protein